MDTEQEQSSMSVKEQFEELERVHDARSAVLEKLEENRELGQLLWQEQMGNFYSMMNLIPHQMHFDGFEYTQPELLHLHDYDDMAAMTEAYVQSLVPINSREHSLCLRYSHNQGFVLKEGFEFPFRHRLAYLQMTLDDGDVLQMPDVANGERETNDIVHRGDFYCYQGEFTADDPQPATVSAEFDAQLPANLIEFEFTAADVGETMEQDGYLVTLLEFEQGRYAIEIDAVEGQSMDFGSQDVLAEAVDEYGNYIAWRGTEREPLHRAQRIDNLLDDLFNRADQGTLDEATARSELINLRDTLKEEQGRKLFLSRAFNGSVDKALITLMVYSEDSEEVRRELELPVYNSPAPMAASEENLRALPQIPLTAPVYDGRIQLRTSVVELNEELLQQQMRMVQYQHAPGEGFAESEYSSHMSWFYPPVQSDFFLNKRDRAGGLHVLATFDFYDEQGEPVEALEPEETESNIEGTEGPESEARAYEYQHRKIEYPFMIGQLLFNPDQFTAQPASVKAKLPMIVAPNLIKDSYAKDDLPTGITLNGNQLMIDYAVFEPREIAEVTDEVTQRRNQVFVKDSHGYLAEIRKDTFFHPHLRRVAVDVYYFYGEPETVEIWYKGQTTLHEYEVELPLLSGDGIQAQ
ncbi:hypothetical protein CWE14_07615 [Aliidiomarina soli]|uniref:Uncharacterized protein n=2 Tax=Aliidiomarina soli TaxID=1928574 RepID=A0A432WH28_9GAMM|nr:hypothetical protein CWE14_07615 [Aliidiomarina soli]